jgi:hypothetical protein
VWNRRSQLAGSTLEAITTIPRHIHRLKTKGCNFAVTVATTGYNADNLEVITSTNTDYWTTPDAIHKFKKCRRSEIFVGYREKVF